jgi:DNA helicase II / ATP-dependent DNA helicase PcrA
VPCPLALATTRQADLTFKQVAERLLGVGQPYKTHGMGKYRRVHLEREAPD